MPAFDSAYNVHVLCRPQVCHKLTSMITPSYGKPAPPRTTLAAWETGHSALPEGPQQNRLSRVSTPVVGLVPPAIAQSFFWMSFRSVTSVPAASAPPSQTGEPCTLGRMPRVPDTHAWSERTDPEKQHRHAERARFLTTLIAHLPGAGHQDYAAAAGSCTQDTQAPCSSQAAARARGRGRAQSLPLMLTLPRNCALVTCRRRWPCQRRRAAPRPPRWQGNARHGSAGAPASLMLLGPSARVGARARTAAGRGQNRKRPVLPQEPPPKAPTSA